MSRVYTRPVSQVSGKERSAPSTHWLPKSVIKLDWIKMEQRSLGFTLMGGQVDGTYHAVAAMLQCVLLFTATMQ